MLLPINVLNTIFASHMNVVYPEIVVLKATSYTVPDDIDFVLGIDNFPIISPQHICPKGDHLLSDNVATTPLTILQSYNIVSYESTSPENSQAVAAFQDNYFSSSDLRQFQEQFDVPSNPIDKIVGGNKDMIPRLKPSIDVQYITGVGRKVATW